MAIYRAGTEQLPPSRWQSGPTAGFLGGRYVERVQIVLHDYDANWPAMFGQELAA